MLSLRVDGDSPQEVQAKLAAAREAVEPKGLEGKYIEAIGQLHRFVAANIQVDSGRAKNSVFGKVEIRGNGVMAMLGASAKHAPYVGHKPKQSSILFFDYAKKKEVPAVLEWLQADIIATVEEPFA